ncbi:MAG: hypothetical protein HGA25_08840, partial [Clostridiales bacterium]|nr:hypothetical protein [Clostridiales bacterium]
MKKDKIKELLLYSLIIIVLVVLDQMTKTYAIMNLKEKPPLIIIDGILELNYLENLINSETEWIHNCDMTEQAFKAMYPLIEGWIRKTID